MCVCREGRATRAAVVDGVGLCSSFAPNKNGKMFGVLEELLYKYTLQKNHDLFSVLPNIMIFQINYGYKQ